MTRQRRQHSANDRAASLRRPHRLPWFIAILILASSCGGADEGISSPSISTRTIEPSSASVAPSQHTGLQMRQVLEVVPRSSADWDETKLTCSGQGEALSECVASARDVGHIVLLRTEEGGNKYVLGSVIVDETGVLHATAQREGPMPPPTRPTGPSPSSSLPRQRSHSR